MDMLRMLLLGIALAGVIGGPYILYLAFTKPQLFPKPKRARWEGAIAFLVGVIVLLIFFVPWQPLGK